MANRIVLNPISYHGRGAIAEIANEVKARGLKKAFVCSDPDLLKFGVTKKVTDVLDNAGLDYEIYSNIKPNPTIENVQTGVAAYKKSGADYIKTSTGFSKAGATFHDVELFAAHVAPHVKIKAAGGISSLEDAQKFIELGASRLGTSRIVKIAKSLPDDGSY